MKLSRATFTRYLSLALLTASFATTSQAQRADGALQGRVVDVRGAVIIGAVVTLTDARGIEKTAITNGEGRYALGGLAPGKYRLRVTSPGFAAYENPEVEVATGLTTLDVELSVVLETQDVSVRAEKPVSTDPGDNASAIVVRGADLDALPDDPEELADALRALAGPTAGPSGSEILVDGFAGLRLPSKNSIREVRINQNPFSAESSELGFGRIEIFTKPGSDKFGGQLFLNFNDESLNSRNPFAPNRAPYQMRFFGGSVSGPLWGKRASFFIDLDRREVSDNAVINATILDASTLGIVPFAEAVVTPLRRTTFNPRFDYQLNPNHTLVARYTYTRASLQNGGVGNFSLLPSAYDSASTEHSVQLTETAVLNQSLINETRFQFTDLRRRQEGRNVAPAIRVLDAFVADTQFGLLASQQSRWELQNTSTWVRGAHSLRAGAGLRGVSLSDSSTQNFGGTYIFGGGLAPQLDAQNRVVNDAAGQPVLVPVTSIERYRRTLLFLREGRSPEEVRALGGGATQFSVVTGEPEARVRQVDLSAFIQDDWRLRNNFQLSLGLRYETQNNISSNLNFAPRAVFGWAPGGGDNRQAKIVIRGGFGIFYDRVSENLTLQARRFNGISQQQFIVSDPVVLNAFPAVPPVESLNLFAAPQVIRVKAEDLRTPYTIQFAGAVDRQLPHNFALSVTYLGARALHLLRSRNVNAPVLIAQDGGRPPLVVRPSGDATNIYRYESTGVFNQNQLIVSLTNRLNRFVTLNAAYALAKASSDTDGAGSFPANSYDLSTEYGPSNLDVRHRFFISGTIRAPWQIRLNPLINAFSGRPFNITTGRDTNGDTLFTERPAFATDLTREGVIVTPFGAFNPNPTPGELIIPRNFGRGPSIFTVNLRVSRTFGLGRASSPTPAPAARGGAAAGGGAAGQGPAGARRAGGGAGDAGRRYSLVVSAQVQNLFNRTNVAIPIGNLSSPLFGSSNAPAGGSGFGANTSPGAGNRRVELQLRFNF